MAFDYTIKHAILSPDGRYRFKLNRAWVNPAATTERGCMFVMLNPSTADAEIDDPTIRRCVGIAHGLGYYRLTVCNLFAFRATNPKQLLSVPESDDPIGWRNQEYVEIAASDAGIIICAWGAHGSHMEQDETMLGWLSGHERKLHCLARTKDGHPKHPLYLRNGLMPVRFQGRTP